MTFELKVLKHRLGEKEIFWISEIIEKALQVLILLILLDMIFLMM